uniref:Uncharacterized protein n=1 Tax=Romanomermis culicivorax TaxID=13658 RepID=A0A915IZZ4_ROMCU
MPLEHRQNAMSNKMDKVLILMPQIGEWFGVIKYVDFTQGDSEMAIQCMRDGMPLRKVELGINIPKSTLANKVKNKNLSEKLLFC